MKKATSAALGLLISLTVAFGGGGSREVPPITSAGTFAGTWYYVDRAYKIAIFMTHDQTGQLTMRYHVLAAVGYEYETDAGGYGRYINEGTPVDVIFSGGTDRGESLYNGTFERTTISPDKTAIESGEFKMYRGYEGTTLVLRYPDYKTDLFDAAGNLKSSAHADVMLVFRKASDLVLDFAEIPF